MATTGFITSEGMDLGNLLVKREIFSEGGLWLWGSNSTYGQLGINTTSYKNSPVQTICGGLNWKQVAGKRLSTAAIKTDGTLWLWGSNDSGSLGDNSVTNRSSPVQTICGGTNWKVVSESKNYITAAIKTDGTLWCWGRNGSGTLGDNSVTNRSSPVQTIAGGMNWKQVDCGYTHLAAIKTDGTLWLWGANTAGQLGINSTISRSSPVQTICGGTNWKQVACGYYHNLGIKTDGTLWLWGQNSSGQLGDNSIVNRSSPVQTITGGTSWKYVSCGQSHITAIKTDGTLWCWGNNQYGKLGNNSTLSQSSPIQTVAGGTKWKQVSCGINHTAAIKTDGTLWGWGDNYYGTLGTGTNVNKSSPVQTITGGTNWKQVSCGSNFTTAIKDDIS